MLTWSTLAGEQDTEFIVYSGVRLRKILSAELFYSLIGLSSSGETSGSVLTAQCQARWTDLADALAAMPEPAEMIVVFGCLGNAHQGNPEIFVAFLSMGRGATRSEAEQQCLRQQRNLWVLLETILDYAELEPIRSDATLQAIVSFLSQPHVAEIQRRYDNVRVSHGVLVREPIGFDVAPLAAPELVAAASSVDAVVAPVRFYTGGFPEQPEKLPGLPRRASERLEHGHYETEPQPHHEDLQLSHLYPWVPSEDSWRRLLEALTEEPSPAALVVHLRGWQQAPEVCREEASRALVVAERIARFDVLRVGETIPQLQADVLRHEALKRLAILDGRVLAARLFISAGNKPSPALVATIVSCLDDASIRPGQSGADSMFRGGAQCRPSSSAEIVSPLDEPQLGLLYGPAEAGAFLRTPMPTDIELPSLAINRARTAAIVGHSGDDVPLGANVHRGLREPVALDGPMRFRHTYIVGQTGTGKSTLLLHMILHDINNGRGVGVLDPH